MSELRVRAMTSLAELDAIEPTWRVLERHYGNPAIFQSWAWNRAWSEHVLEKQNNANLYVLLVEDGAGRAFAILPFFQRKLVGSILRITQFLGHRMSYSNDVLLAEPDNTELAEAVTRLLTRVLGTTDVLHLRHLNEKSTFTRALLAHDVAKPQCPRTFLEAAPGLDDQSKRLGPSRRKACRLAANRLRKQFTIAFPVMGVEHFAAAFDELIELHHRRFDAARRTTLLSGANLDFLRHVCDHFARTGAIEILRLRADDRTLASALMARQGPRYYFVQGGFDPEFSRFSPMRLLLTETMRRAFDDLRCTIYDLGPGYESYKFDWKPIVGTNYYACIGGPGAYGRVAAAAYDGLFRYQLRRAIAAKE
jgi:CelD/BcsL family acetyltransferase involved in cellulose biosynthesis